MKKEEIKDLTIIKEGKKRYFGKFKKKEQDVLMNIFYDVLDEFPDDTLSITLIKCTFETISDTYNKLCNQKELAEEQFRQGYLTEEEYKYISQRLNGNI